VSEEALSVTDAPCEEEVRFLEDQIDEHNFEVTGYRDGRRLTILVRNANGAIRAGLAGHTWGGCCEVRFLWVRGEDRRQGFGSRLLAAAEREATERGCSQIVLGTHSFQAPDFYRARGYTVAGEVAGYPRGYSQIFLRKPLGRAAE
jgi:ribosomal protein S18 acetylase RimI-like enzyme